MIVATYNVNGVNGRLPVLLRWLAERQPDVVCLQELKAAHERFPEEAIRAAGYSAIWRGQKSWNGVAILVRGGGGRGAERLPVSAERQSGAGTEIRLQAALVRPPDCARRGADAERRAGRAGRRLQRDADGAGRLQAGALAGRCAVPPGSARGL